MPPARYHGVMRTVALVVLAAVAGALVHRAIAGRDARPPAPEPTATATASTPVPPAPASRPEPPTTARASEPVPVPVPLPAPPSEPPSGAATLELRDGRPFLHLEGTPSDGGVSHEELLRKRLAELEESRSTYDRMANQARAEGNRPRPAVTMWSASWCGVCRRAKRWLDARHVTYAERDIDQSPAARRDLLARNPRGSVPTFDIGGQTMIGFSEGRMEQLLRP